MTDEARELWERAGNAPASARRLVPDHSDHAAVMAYYAAFYAVSALFCVEGRSYTQH